MTLDWRDETSAGCDCSWDRASLAVVASIAGRAAENTEASELMRF